MPLPVQRQASRFVGDASGVGAHHPDGPCGIRQMTLPMKRIYAVVGKAPLVPECTAPHSWRELGRYDKDFR